MSPDVELTNKAEAEFHINNSINYFIYTNLLQNKYTIQSFSLNINSNLCFVHELHSSQIHKSS